MPLIFAYVIILSFALLLAVRFGLNSNHKKTAKLLFNIYALLIGAVLARQIHTYIGFGKYETPMLPPHLQRGIAHVGCYTAPDSEFTLTAKGKKNGFGTDLLDENEKITLTPLFKNRRADFWSVRYNHLTYPLRVNNRCVNLTGKARFTHPENRFYISMTKKKQRYIAVFQYRQNTFYFSLIVKPPNEKASYSIQNQPTAKINLREGIKISDLFLLSPNHQLKNNIKSIPQELRQSFREVRLIREIKDNTNSPIGIILDPALVNHPTLSFFMNDTPLPPREKEEETVVNYRDSITYGFGNRVFSAALPCVPSTHEDLGNIMECYFKAPHYYPLPPNPHKPFIITNQNSHILLDGYYFHMGELHSPIYAKASLSENLTTLTINDGKEKRDYNLGQTIHFGDRRRGVLLSFQSKQAAIAHTGLKAAGIFLLLTAFFILLNTWQKDPPIPLQLSWTVTWGITLTLLVFRLIEAYRVSLLPPIDISPKEIQLFHKSLTVSFWGFLFLPLGMLLVKLISTARLLGWLEKKISGGILTYPLFLLSPAVVIAAVYFENNPAVFNLNFRASIGVHLFIIVLLVFTAPSLVSPGSKRAFFYFSLTGIFVLMVFYLKDVGFIVNGISLGMAVFILVHWNRRRNIELLLPLSLTAAFFILLLWAGPHISQQLAKLIPQEKHWHYRMMENQENWEQLLLDDSRKNVVKMRLLLRNAHQRWQMLLYAAEGCRQPRGFGKAPLGDRGMTYPAALTDCFYASFVLSEWGKETGVLLILLLFTLGFFIIYPGGFLPTGYRYRIIPLTAIGLFFIVNSLYISSANIGLMPFSGINLPLFGLYSRSDIVQSGIFILFALWLTHDSIQTGTQKFCEDPPVVRYLFVVLLAGVLTWIGLHYFQLKELGRNDSYTRDFNFSQRFYDTLGKNISPGRNNSFSLNAGTLHLDYLPYGGFLTEIEEQFIHHFNKSDDKFKRNGLYYLEKRTNGENIETSTLCINRYYFALSSPFKKKSLWRGVIHGHTDINGPSITALGKHLTVTLLDDGHAQSMALNRDNPFTGSRTLLLTENGLRNSIIICELLHNQNQLRLIPRSKHWSIYIEGEKVENKTRLRQHDIVVFQHRGGRRFNWLYLGYRKPLLAYLKWRNGKEHRVFPYGKDFAMPFTLSKAADTAKARGIKPPEALQLSVDMKLHQELKTIIREFARSGDNGNYRPNNPLETPRIALTVMDAHTGEIAAMPSYPEVDPNETGFERRILNFSPHRQVRLLTNFNLLNHENGSTFKPLFLSAVGTALWPEIDVGRFIIHNKCIPGDSSGHICLHSHIAGIPILPWDSLSNRPVFSTKDFLVLSEDYGIVIGWLGLVMKKKDIWRVLTPPQGEPDFVYKDRRFTFDLTQLPPGSSPFSLKDTFPRITSSIEKATVFKSLEQLFDFHITGDYYNILRRCGEGFLPSFRDFDFKTNMYLNNIIPEPVVFNPRYYQYNRGHLISFFLGGGPNRINNIAMARAAARMVTGRKVTVTLEKRLPGSTRAPVLPHPLGLTEWRNDNLVFPLEQVGITGTARELSDLVEFPFKVIYKTGTIIKSEKNGRESETILFVIGRWEGDEFKGKTLVGFLYMEDSKNRKDPQKKFQLARPVIKALTQYLDCYKGGNNDFENK